MVLFVDEDSPVLERSGTPPRARLDVMSDVLRLPQVLDATRQDSEAVDLEDRLEVKRTGDLLRVIARGGTPPEAVRLANIYAAEGLSVIRALETLGGRRLPLGDFEGSTDGWAGLRWDGAEPTTIQGVGTVSRFNSASLRVACEPGARCGAGYRFRYPFRGRARYVVTGWARSASAAPPSVNLFIGSSPRDERHARRPPTLTPRWRAFRVSWTPPADSSFADVSFKGEARRRSSFDVDGVSMADLTAQPPEPPPQSRAFRRGRYLIASPARAVGTVRASTALWALGGAGVGLLAALGAISFGMASARRR